MSAETHVRVTLQQMFPRTCEVRGNEWRLPGVEEACENCERPIPDCQPQGICSSLLPAQRKERKQGLACPLRSQSGPEGRALAPIQL